MLGPIDDSEEPGQLRSRALMPMTKRGVGGDWGSVTDCQSDNMVFGAWRPNCKDRTKKEARALTLGLPPWGLLDTVRLPSIHIAGDCTRH
jgi:hypothetical protein